ncbi:hypothetical protein KP509_1Z082800 [Ceratopteris richardii]|nr:hypothetical protein KP509_1Z082800 [Ceratopteris richardii]
MDFVARKRAVLSELSSPLPDKSRKGGVDDPILPLITRINKHPSYFTTSSCSGRISISISAEELISRADMAKTTHVDGDELHEHENRTEVENNVNEKKKKNKKKKKGGDWSFVSHSQVDADEVIHSVLGTFQDNKVAHEPLGSLMVFRFEPFILAVECADLCAAQALVSCAISSGFRESGVTNLRKRIIVAVRCSIRIETPIARDGQLLVSEDYLRFLVELANSKMTRNSQRTLRFFSAFVGQIETNMYNDDPTIVKHESKSHAHRRNRRTADELKGRKFVDLEMRQLTLLRRLDKVETLFYSSDLGHTNINEFHHLSGEDPAWNEKDTMISRGKHPLHVKGHVENPSKGNIATTRNKQACRQNLPPAYERGRFSYMKMDDKGLELLNRWGHSTCLLPFSSSSSMTSLLIFGGYGGSIKQGRQNDLVLFTYEDGRVSSLCAMNPPVARVGHTASLVGKNMVVIGGREDPSRVLGDVCVLNVDSMHWSYPKVRGVPFPPRHRHAAEAYKEKIYVFGGLDNENVLGDFLVLDVLKMQWDHVMLAGYMPCPRYSHSMAVIDEILFVYGGFNGRTVYGDLWILDLINFRWKTVELETIPRFSHTMTSASGKLVILGGCPLTKHTNVVSFFCAKDFRWVDEMIKFPINSFFIRHTATCVGEHIITIGGGLSCYAFGIRFSPPFLFYLPVLLSLSQSCKSKESRLVRSFHSEENHEDVCSMMVDKSHAKICKDYLKHMGWLDSKRNARESEDGLNVLFPLIRASASALQSMELVNALESCKKLCSICAFECQVKLEVVRLKAATPKKCPKDPYQMLLEALSSLLQKNGLPLSLLNEVPKKWERLDDMAILPANSFSSKCWSLFGSTFWQILLECFKVKRVARQARIKPTQTRDSNLILLYGHHAWVQHRENGIIYCFDATKCMFSSGNISEKLRMAKLECSNETIVDLFAGIGYFVLPLLVKANAKKVYACEWNPSASEALQYNLRVNAVEDRCVVLEGDNRFTAPQGIANRVCLGLLPTSRKEVSYTYMVM